MNPRSTKGSMRRPGFRLARAEEHGPVMAAGLMRQAGDALRCAAATTQQ
jgi:hypothetical protein